MHLKNVFKVTIKLKTKRTYVCMISQYINDRQYFLNILSFYIKT